MPTPLTRRAWLQGMTALGSCGLRLGATPAYVAEEAAAKIRFGFSLYGMKSLKVSEALAACAKIGYEGIELALLPDWPADPKRLNAEDRKELKRQLADVGLALFSLMENLAEPAEESAHRANLERLKAAARRSYENLAPAIQKAATSKP